METITIKTVKRNQIIDITGQVREIVDDKQVMNGLVMVFVPHTTAAVTINENADPAVKVDILEGLRKIAPADASYYTHAEGNADAHIKASLIGASVTALINRGKLVLGTWQGILFCEFDGPRTREVHVSII